MAGVRGKGKDLGLGSIQANVRMKVKKDFHEMMACALDDILHFQFMLAQGPETTVNWRSVEPQVAVMNSLK